MTPTQRTLAALRDSGYKTAIVEKFNYHAGPHGIRQDLFGFIDVIALKPGQAILGVQSTGTDFAGHVKKILHDRTRQCLLWLACGGEVQLWGWRKVVEKRGSKRKVYRPRVQPVTFQDFTDAGYNLAEFGLDPLT